MLAKDSKILIVDDSKIIRLSMRNFFQELGYDNIVFGEDGEHALSVYGMENPDLIVMDVVMPNLSGDEALEKLRANDKDTPVIMLTSVADGDIITKCKNLGISNYILKPLTKEKGPEILKEAISGL